PVAQAAPPWLTQPQAGRPWVGGGGGKPGRTPPGAVGLSPPPVGGGPSPPGGAERGFGWGSSPLPSGPPAVWPPPRPPPRPAPLSPRPAPRHLSLPRALALQEGLLQGPLHLQDRQGQRRLPPGRLPRSQLRARAPHARRHADARRDDDGRAGPAPVRGLPEGRQ